MNYKINWATSKSLDYDTVLENVTAVVFFDKEINRYAVVNMIDRKKTDDNGYPWYKGAFGNCIIYLNSQRTDILYLLGNKAVEKVNKAVGKRNYTNIDDDEVIELYEMIEEQLETHALSTISREENANAKAG